MCRRVFIVALRRDMKTLFSLASIHFIRKSKIRDRVLVSLILLSLLPLLITGVISYSESTTAIQKNTRIFSTEIVKQVSKNVQLQMAQIETSSQELVLSRPVQLAFSQSLSSDPAKNSPARSDLTRILLDAYGSFDYINQKYFLGLDQRVLDSQTFPQISDAVQHLVATIPDREEKAAWTVMSGVSNQKSIVMFRKIYLTANAQISGTLFLGIRASHFSKIFDNVDLGLGSDIFIIDVGTGDILVKTFRQASFVGSDACSPALLAAMHKNLPEQNDAKFTTYELVDRALDGTARTEKFVAAYAVIPNTTWAVVSTIPYQNLIIEAQSVRNKFILIGCLCLIFSIGLAYLIARSISDPLEKLIAKMNEAEKGNYAVRMANDGHDEITALSHNFNKMADWINQDQEKLELRVNERTRELEVANKQLAALSMTDSLTGIANRRCFDEILSNELQRATRTGQKLAVMMIDVDFFKSYNDHYGHNEGDICLRRIAELMHVRLRRASELVARYGGEEFVILVPDTDDEQAIALAKTICDSVEELAIPNMKSPLADGYVTVSVGLVVLVPQVVHSPSSLMLMADQAMYEAKKSGRNRVVRFSNVNI